MKKCSPTAELIRSRRVPSRPQSAPTTNADADDSDPTAQTTTNDEADDVRLIAEANHHDAKSSLSASPDTPPAQSSSSSPQPLAPPASSSSSSAFSKLRISIPV